MRSRKKSLKVLHYRWMLTLFSRIAHKLSIDRYQLRYLSVANTAIISGMKTSANTTVTMAQTHISIPWTFFNLSSFNPNKLNLWSKKNRTKNLFFSREWGTRNEKQRANEKKCKLFNIYRYIKSDGEQKKRCRYNV